MRVVIDTNVIASAIFFGGKPRQLLEHLMKRNLEAFATNEIIVEYQETCDELCSRYPNKPLQLPLNQIIAACKIIESKSVIRICRDADDDKFIIKSQFDEVIQEGKIYSKNNRTYVAFNDQMVDSYLILDIHNNKKYDIKYSVFSNEKNITEENINDDYKIELINTNQELPYVKFRPLIKKKEIEYSIYMSFDKSLDLSSVTNLMKLESNENKLYIMTKSINSDDDFIKFDLTSEISNLINNKNWILNILAKEKEKYNITKQVSPNLHSLKCSKEGGLIFHIEIIPLTSKNNDIFYFLYLFLYLLNE